MDSLEQRPGPCVRSAIRAGKVPDMTAGIYYEVVFDFDPAIGQAV
jgi:hypothetical protein